MLSKKHRKQLEAFQRNTIRRSGRRIREDGGVDGPYEHKEEEGTTEPKVSEAKPAFDRGGKE